MIYLDNAATTKAYGETSDIFHEYNCINFFNPSALYKNALDAAKKLGEARAGIASAIGCSAKEVYFTSGATEANNTVISNAHKNKKGLMIITEGEHPSVYSAAVREQSKGAALKILPLNNDGTVNSRELDLIKDISLVSIIHVSNETGAVNDIATLVKKIKNNNPKALIHSDGVQAVGKTSVNVKKLGVDLYSFSGHKLHAPKGVGVLYIREGIKIAPYLVGGGQEYGMRSGTENTAAIMALSYSLNRRLKEYDGDYVKKLKEIFVLRLSVIHGAVINSGMDCLPNIISVSFKNVRGEVLLHSLEKHNIIIGTGSACSSKNSDNRVLSGMGIPNEMIKCSIRLSFDEHLKEEDAVFACEKITKEINEIRRISE